MISKNGIILTPSFCESEAMYLAKIKNYSYVPNTDSNSCMGLCTIDYGRDVTVNDVFRVIMNVSYENFDTIDPESDFNIYLQTAYRNEQGDIVSWPSNIALSSAINNSRPNLKTLLMSSQKGTHQYNATYKLNDYYIQNYYSQYYHIRSNYSNDIGRITVDNMIVIPDKYYIGTGQTVKAHINNDYISTNNIIEI